MNYTICRECHKQKRATTSEYCDECYWGMPDPRKQETEDFGKILDEMQAYREAHAAVTGHFSDVEFAQKSMGIDWMGQHELAQAIPPAYTEWIGLQIQEHCASTLLGSRLLRPPV